MTRLTLEESYANIDVPVVSGSLTVWVNLPPENARLLESKYQKQHEDLSRKRLRTLEAMARMEAAGKDIPTSLIKKVQDFDERTADLKFYLDKIESAVYRNVLGEDAHQEAMTRVF